MSAIDNARRHLFRALEAERSVMREQYLWQAAASLNVAGFPAWAALAEAAAQRTGGDDRDVSDLLFDVDRECSRREHALPPLALPHAEAFVRVASTPEMRNRLRELATPSRDDFDRAVLIILDDFDRLASARKAQP